MRLLVALIFVGLLLAGCGGGRDWDEGWRDAGGHVVPDNVVTSFDGTCVDGAVFLVVAWPLGKPVDNIAKRRWYVRDPEVDTDATLPESARNTGYRLGDLQLWLGRDARNAAYIVEGPTVERWPLTEPVGCQ